MLLSRNAALTAWHIPDLGLPRSYAVPAVLYLHADLEERSGFITCRNNGANGNTVYYNFNSDQSMRLHRHHELDECCQREGREKKIPSRRHSPPGARLERSALSPIHDAILEPGAPSEAQPALPDFPFANSAWDLPDPPPLSRSPLSASSCLPPKLCPPGGLAERCSEAPCREEPS